MAIVVGKIIGIKGTVRVFNTETQEMRVVEEGAEIFLDEVVITEDGATVAIATVDGNTISLGGSSEFVIDNDSVPVAALRELPDAIIGNFESLQAAIIDGNFESVTDAGTTLADEQVDLLRSQAETINTNNEAEELSSSNQEGVEDERNAETGEVTAGYVTETREIDLEEAAEATDDAVDEVAVNTPEPETEPDPETEPEPDPDPETTPDPEVDPDPVNVIIRLIALDDTQVPILDENGHYTLANTVLEGNDGNYMALAFASDATEFSPATRLEDQQGSVSITFGNLSAVGSDSQTTDDGSQDFNNTPILTISLDIPFNTGTYDDYLSDGGEQYTVTILPTSFVDPNETYTDVIIDESPVITTIIDDGQPNTPFDPNDPVEPNMESVRVVLVPTDAAGNIIDPVTIPEGETAYFKVILLDPNGNEIPNATGDVDVVFTDGTAVRTGTSEDAELDFAANNQTVSINQVFSADALGDYLSDSGETFDVAIV
ncbi:hypothetical protein, partial [Vibrio parahaemolyticus]|uniref:hypothetical protein n=1 Tax=Vibrio parahaemolyticus TaxID=670 RepID=UPI003AB03F57